jgi:hypothetical protein
MAEGPQIAFLHGVFGISARQQVPRERIGVVKMRQSELLEAARLAALIIRRAICSRLAPVLPREEPNSHLPPH